MARVFPVSLLLRDHVHGNDHKDTACRQRGYRDQQRRHVRPHDGVDLQCVSSKCGVATPAAHYYGGTDDERRKWHRNEENIEADKHVMTEPVDQMSSPHARLNGAEEECTHEECRRNDE